MRKIIILLSLSFLLFSQCSDHQIFDPTFWSKSFKGITFTDEHGFIIHTDASDWCYNYPNDVMYMHGPIPAFFEFGPAYPNPVQHKGIIHILLELPKSDFCEVHVINQDYKIIATIVKTQLPPGFHSVEWDLAGTLPGVYRIIFNSDNFHCEGDIWIQ